VAIYRNQWSSISLPYQTGLVTGEARFPVKTGPNDFVSVGILAYYDKAGSVNLQTMALYPALSYNKLINSKHNSYLSVGFTGGYLQYSFDPSKATFNNQYVNNKFSASNPSGESLPNPRFYNLDLGGGVAFNSSTGKNDNVTYVAGISGYHFSTPSNSFSNDPSIRLEMKWNATLGLACKLNETYTLQANANYWKQGQYSEFIAGGFVGWNKQMATESADVPFAIYGGVFYRVGDAIIPAIKLSYKNYNFGLVYDVNVSTLKAGSDLRGGFEISFFTTGIFKNSNADRGKTICPNNFF